MPADKPKRPPGPWVIALQQWNEGREGKYTVPRKGTPEYEEVRALMVAKPVTTAPTEPEAPIAEASAPRKGKAKAKPVPRKKPTIDLSDSPL